MKLPFIALLLSLSLLVPSVQPALAQAGPQPGTLIKTFSNPAIYWYSNTTGRRHVFPNMQTFYSWYSPYDLYRVHTVSDAEMAALRIGTNVTIRPATRLLKITTDPKVYVVEATSTIRWIESEPVAVAMFGPHWQDLIVDVPDAFFVNYTAGRPISTPSDFNPRPALTPNELYR